MTAKKIGESQDKKVIIADPAFQWAQSLNRTFINVKYSKKLDSPGYLDVRNENVEFTDNKMILSADADKVNMKKYRIMKL